MGLMASYGIVSGAGILATLCGLFYILIVSMLSLNERFRSSPFSILFCFFTFLYLNVPAAFILFEGSDYIYGDGLASIPFQQNDYLQSLPLGFLYLSLSWVAVWLGIISVNPNRKEINQNRFSSIRLKHILLLGGIVLVVTWLDNQSFSDVRLEGAEKLNSLLAFIFFDHAYLVVAGLILFFKLNESEHDVDSRSNAMLISAIFIAYISIFFLAGSKGAILVIFMLLVLFPFSCFREYSDVQGLFPTPKFLVMLALLAPVLFCFALIQRISLASGIAPDMSTLLAGLSVVDASMVYDTFSQILYRLSYGGIDRFLLVFQSFIINSFDPDTAIKFVNYLADNTLNLILPGTPFPEAYAPSSQLFPQVIQKDIIRGSGEVDVNALIISFNTQPYTIFGIFMIIFGFSAPVFLYLFTFAFVFIYRNINGIFVKITMLYFFSAALSSYGIEVVLGNSVHLYVSIIIIYLAIRNLSRFCIELPCGGVDNTKRPNSTQAV